MAVKIFFCYAREDEALLNKLKTQLKPLERQRLIEPWHDRDIVAGVEWEKEISDKLASAQILLLMISPDFMASDYCYGIEMKKALERHEKGEARVIPIILSYVHWQGEPLGNLQALPTDAKPITSAIWHNLNEALFDVADGIRKVIEELTKLDALVRLITPFEEKGVGVEDLLRSNCFTKDGANTLRLAREEADHFNHNYVGTEHLLLGLVREREGIATKVLSNLGVKLNKIRSAVEFIIGHGDRKVLGDISLTPRAKKVIGLAVDEARRLHSHDIGSEHLLLGLVKEGEGIAVGVLESLGFNLEELRAEVLNLLKVNIPT